MSDRAVTFIGIVAATIALVAVVVVAILRLGANGLNTAEIVAVIGLIGTLVGIMATLAKADSIDVKVNGHLEDMTKALRDSVPVKPDASASTEVPGYSPAPKPDPTKPA